MPTVLRSLQWRLSVASAEVSLVLHVSAIKQGEQRFLRCAAVVAGAGISRPGARFGYKEGKASTVLRSLQWRLSVASAEVSLVSHVSAIKQGEQRFLRCAAVVVGAGVSRPGTRFGHTEEMTIPINTYKNLVNNKRETIEWQHEQICNNIYHPVKNPPPPIPPKIHRNGVTFPERECYNGRRYFY